MNHSVNQINQRNQEVIQQQQGEVESVYQVLHAQKIRRFFQIFSVRQKTIYALSYFQLMNNILSYCIKPQLEFYEIKKDNDTK